jgi:predicted RND superfamily exporter protein
VNPARIFSAIAGSCARRPLLVLVIAVVLGLGAAALALRLHSSAATDTFVGRSTASYEATQSFYRFFGEEPVDVMVKGNLQDLLESSDVDRLVGLEGCLSGNVPAAGLVHEGGLGGPCAQLGRLHTVKVVIGPGTFINEAAEQIGRELSTQSEQAEKQAKQAASAIERAALAQGHSALEARKLGAEASKLTLQQYAQELELVGATYGLSEVPELNSPSFVSKLVFDNDAKLPGTPKQRFAYLFPSREAALISVRMRPGLDESQRTRTIAAIRRAVAMGQWHMQHGERYLITGEPVIVTELTSSITHSIELLLVAVLLVMALTLSLVFRGRPRLLPLAIAVLATALTFGALSAVGASLTVAQVAVLPVLVGLAVDYAIQFQSRVQEARGEGDTIEDAVRRAAAVAGPTIAAAAAAGGAALLVVLLSPVPTVRGFGLLLVVGIAIAFLCALTAGSAALTLQARRAPAGAGESPAAAGRRTPRSGPVGAAAAPFATAGARLAASWRGARELLSDNAVTRWLARAALVHAVRHPGRVIGVGLALAALGWALDSQTHVETNLEKLVPQNAASLRNLDTLERLSGVGGEIDLMVSAKRVAQSAGGRRAGPLALQSRVAQSAGGRLAETGTCAKSACHPASVGPISLGQTLATPSVIEWMSSYENTVLRRFGYSATRGCGKAQLCPAFSLPDLFQGGALGASTTPSTTGKSSSAAAATQAAKLTRAKIRALLGVIPPYFSQDVLTANRRVATLAFGIRLMPLAQQQRVIETMRSDLHPPRGVSVQLVGLPVLAAQSGAEVASPWRRVLTLLAGLAAAALVLLAAFRGDRRRTFAPLLPVVLATGWSALVVFAIRVPLNPMSVTLSALVIAISTEFSVLLSERHRQERIAGYAMHEALRRTYHYTGAAVAASGVTAIMGFGVLVLSDIAMLRDFGLVTLIDLSVSLLGVLVALPAALLLAEPDELARRLPRRVASRRRHTRVRPRDEPA